jgi:8-oxo-dGTP pyrophosphatase MutT (NUDIX family)
MQARKQFGALPWRFTGQGIEVLLITSRETRRWVIPKGWPIPGLTPPQAAAREAFEEAGVGGQVSKKPLGQFEYDKRLGNGQTQRCEVTVYGLEQMIQHPQWPEQSERQTKWFPVPEAANAVQEAGLAKIIRRLKVSFNRP